VESIITSVVVTEGTPVLVTLDYVIKLDGGKDLRDDTDSERSKRGRLQKVTQKYVEKVSV
jgi:hypothetical protein